MERYWLDSRLTYMEEKNRGVTYRAILSRRDVNKLGKWNESKRRNNKLTDLDLRGFLNNEVHLSHQVKGVYYDCECKIFYFNEDEEECFNYPKLCPLGHPAYEDN